MTDAITTWTRRCKCGKPISHIGVCPECYRENALKEHWITMAKALESVPEHYRWAKFGSQLLYDRVPDLGEWPEVSPAGLFSSRTTVMHGETGAGKTSLATALYYWIVERTTPESDERTIEFARMARWIDASDLWPSPSYEGIPVMAIAQRASVLLLDDVGSEGGAGQGYASQDRYRLTAELLRYRDMHDLATIITTPGYDTPGMAAAKWTEKYGGGIMRRYWEAAGSKVIELRRSK